MGYLPSKKNEIEIHKLYIDQKCRRKGLAKYLVKKVENIAVRENKLKVILWTDTRFKEAHKMYLKMDYEKSKKTRRLYDISDTVEYNFVKHLR
jgi:GNAT superfamily N-acetyltransferase